MSESEQFNGVVFGGSVARVANVAGSCAQENCGSYVEFCFVLFCVVHYKYIDQDTYKSSI